MVILLALTSLLTSVGPALLAGCGNPNCEICYPKKIRDLEALLKQGRKDDALSLALEVLKEDPKNRRALEVLQALKAIDDAKIQELNEIWKKEDAREAERKEATDRNIRRMLANVGSAFYQLQQAQAEGGSKRPFDDASKTRPLPVLQNWGAKDSVKPAETNVPPQVLELRQSRDTLVKDIGALEKKLMTVKDSVERYHVVNEIIAKTSEKNVMEIKMLDLSVKKTHQEDKK